MFNPKPSSRPPKQESNAQPKDALAALMDGDTPDDKSLRFPDERSTSWRAKPSSDDYKRPSSGMQEDRMDYHFNSKPNSSMGEYQPAKANSTLDSVKTGAVKSGTYIKDKSVAGATYVKQKDWTKEKEMAGKAAVHTKNGAVILGNGMVKGAGWLWSSGKNGVESLRNKDKK